MRITVEEGGSPPGWNVDGMGQTVADLVFVEGFLTVNVLKQKLYVIQQTENLLYMETTLALILLW